MRIRAFNVFFRQLNFTLSQEFSDTKFTPLNAKKHKVKAFIKVRLVTLTLRARTHRDNLSSQKLLLILIFPKKSCVRLMQKVTLFLTINKFMIT